ncbi:MAG TPA: response regulator [Anaerolineales bacterium]|nr:response regulator [Anaerolineales bacterium]HMX19946.1 response regulator [Anaerolineales bacterium]HNH04968.1 response regulator [Anaerolineales bacterium]
MENKTSLLLIDDDPALLVGLEAVLRYEGYRVFTARHGRTGIDIARESTPDLIICDLMMPPPNGMEVLTILGQDPRTASIPFIFLTARTSSTDKVHGLLSGADDYVIKPFVKDELLARVKTILRRKQKAPVLSSATDKDEIQHLRNEITEILRNSEVNWEKFVDSLVHMLGLRNNETEDHAWRVMNLTEKTAIELGIHGVELIHIRWGAILHDIGKVGIPDNILLKPGELTKEERNVMMMHPQIASQILEPLGLPSTTLDIPLYHHERWDGKGYPDHLAGDNIPLSARIFSVVDVWDALTNDRPYRKAWSCEKAGDYILGEAGKSFDPHVVDVFLKKVISYS